MYISIKNSCRLQTLMHTERIEALLSYASFAKISHLTSYLWDVNIPDFIDKTLDSKTPNQTLVRRARYIREERALDLIGHLHCDVFNQDKFLINGVEVRIRLERFFLPYGD